MNIPISERDWFLTESQATLSARAYPYEFQDIIADCPGSEGRRR